MASVIIFEKDLKRLGRNLMKEFYEIIHDDYFLNKYEAIMLQRDYYNKNIIDKYLEFVKSYRKDNNIESLESNDILKLERKDVLKEIESKIKDETIDYNFIYSFIQSLRNLDLKCGCECEANEDLFYMKKAFCKIYDVFHYNYFYLN